MVAKAKTYKVEKGTFGCDALKDYEGEIPISRCGIPIKAIEGFIKKQSNIEYYDESSHTIVLWHRFEDCTTHPDDMYSGWVLSMFNTLTHAVMSVAPECYNYGVVEREGMKRFIFDLMLGEHAGQVTISTEPLTEDEAEHLEELEKEYRTKQEDVDEDISVLLKKLAKHFGADASSKCKVDDDEWSRLFKD